MYTEASSFDTPETPGEGVHYELLTTRAEGVIPPLGHSELIELDSMLEQRIAGLTADKARSLGPNAMQRVDIDLRKAHAQRRSLVELIRRADPDAFLLGLSAAPEF